MALRFFVVFCFEGVSSMCVPLCASVHWRVKLRVHVCSYLYHLFTFPCLYLVAVSHLSPPLCWATSRSLRISRMPHDLLTQHCTSTINLDFFSSKKINAYVNMDVRENLGSKGNSFLNFADSVSLLLPSFLFSHLLIVSLPHPRHVPFERQMTAHTLTHLPLRVAEKCVHVC